MKEEIVKEAPKRERRRSRKKKEKTKKGFFKRFLSFIVIATTLVLTCVSIATLGVVMIAHKELETIPKVDAQYLKTMLETQYLL